MKKDFRFICKKKCIDLSKQIICPKCEATLIPVCVNLGIIDKTSFYCLHNFPEDCSKFGCPKYNYVAWKVKT